MKKITALLLFTFLMLSSLSSCSLGFRPVEKENRETTSAAESSAESAADDQTTTADTPAETEPSVTEPVVPPTPVDISTTGGIVIVGTIGYENGSWYIAPEQPLNLSFEYFLDNPSVFPGLTRIRMMDPRDDGVDKAVYLGQTVTVQGELRFVRDDFETPYLGIFSIVMGRNAEQSYGDPTLRAPEGPVDLWDPSIPLPKYMEPMISDGKYSYNAFMLSEETLSFMGNDFALFYLDFVDALLGYRSEVPCEEERFAEMLGTVMYYDFPLFNACAQPFEYLKHYDPQTKTVRIEYKYSKDEHQKLLDRFLAATDEMLSTVTPEMSDVEKARQIYHQLCIRMNYDDSALEILERKDSCYAYLENSGVCITFANVYNQLLTQVGIQTTQAACDYAATYGHAWSIVTLDGQDYFCDPTFELNRDNGNGYVYFGLNYADRTADGLGAGGIRAGRYYTYPMDASMLAPQSLK